MASCTTLDSGASARVANITEPMSAPALMTLSSIRNTPHTSITSVTACCAMELMFSVQLEILRVLSMLVA